MSIGGAAARPRATLDSEDIHDDVSLIAHLAFAKANQAEQRDDAGRPVTLFARETLELDLSDPAQRMFGGYELLELIGEGGMGVVYRARQIGLDREVAVKLLAAGPWASAEFVERFQREAQNAARMQHPNIVAIYEVGDAEDLQFFSMRLVRGGSLSAVLKHEHKLPPLRAAQLLRTIAEAVDYAHRLGVLHLDLKPGNVLLDEDGVPHVADFGLARRLDQGLAADNTEVSGTPSYMAPEQATAGVQNITPATDIWGLGAVLYELVAGVPPFLASTPHGTLKLVVDGAMRSPRRHAPDLPLDLEAIVLKCLSRNVADRYPSGRALADDLTRFIEGREVRARPLNAAQRAARWARREPRLAATALLAVAALLIGLAATTKEWRRADTNARLSEQHAATSNERLWASRRENALRLMKDGNGFDALPLLVTNVDEQQRAGGSDDHSIERLSIGMILSHGVTLIDRMIIPDANPMTAALSPDGSLLAVALNDISVRWYDTATLTERGRVDLSALPTSDSMDHVPQLLRFVDNHRLRVTLEWYGYSSAPSDTDTHLIDLDRGVVVVAPPQFADFRHSVFSPDGRRALLFDDHHQVQLWQVDPWRALAAPAPLQSDYTMPFLLLGETAVRSYGSFEAFDHYDPRNPKVAKPFVLPVHESIVAWTVSGDGRSVALGDGNGQVFITDIGTMKTRSLPIPTGRDVSWLAYSEDDAWIAVARRDGAAYVFEAATGVPLHSGALQHDFPLRHVAVSARDRLLVASGAGETVIWNLSEGSPGGLPASRMIAGPTHSPKAGPYWSGVSFEAGLLATADLDGEVRLWRLPASGRVAMKSAQRGQGALRFEGGRLPDVAWDQVRVASLDAGAANTPWVKLPQPIALADLVDHAHSLVAVAGTQLYLFDAATMQPRFAPVTLPANPLRLAVDAAGKRALLTFGVNTGSGFRERIESVDLGSGKLRAESALVAGPLRQFELSPDDSRLITVGREAAATEVFDAATLQRIGVYPHDPERPVLRVASTSASALWLVTRNIDETQSDNAGLILWDPLGEHTLQQRNVVGIRPVGITALVDRPVLAGSDRIVLDPGAPDALASGRLFLGEASTVFATSHDRRLIAYAFGREVYLYDATSMTQVAAPLHTDIGIVDMIPQLAFSSDDRSLLVRSATQQWFVWPVASDQRPRAELRYDADLLHADDTGPRFLRASDPQESRRLRQRDPGRHRDADPRPHPAVAHTVAGVPVPARQPDLSPLLLDLGKFYSSAPDSRYNINDSVMPSMDECQFGLTRIEGVDYDVRGGVELRWGLGGRTGGSQSVHMAAQVRGIRVPATPVAAFHLLIFAPSPVPVDGERTYASVRLHYRDGSEAVLPLRTNREVPGFNERDYQTPIAWDQGAYLPLIGVWHGRIVNNPRLPNPHPEKLIDTLDIETSKEGWSAFMVFAITAEPVIEDTQARSPGGTGQPHG